MPSSSLALKFMVISFAQFTEKSGLRDIETTINRCSPDLYHLDLKVMQKIHLGRSERKEGLAYISELYTNFDTTSKGSI